MNKSPLMVQMAFAHAHTTMPQQFFSHATWGSQAAISIREILEQKGLLDDKGNGTDKLRFWVEHVCKIPWPEQNFIIPIGGPGPIMELGLPKEVYGVDWGREVKP